MSASISVIMPCYNAAATIGDAIGSAQARTFRDRELIVVDIDRAGGFDPTLQASVDDHLWLRTAPQGRQRDGHRR